MRPPSIRVSLGLSPLRARSLASTPKCGSCSICMSIAGCFLPHMSSDTTRLSFQRGLAREVRLVFVRFLSRIVCSSWSCANKALDRMRRATPVLFSGVTDRRIGQLVRYAAAMGTIPAGVRCVRCGVQSSRRAQPSAFSIRGGLYCQSAPRSRDAGRPTLASSCRQAAHRGHRRGNDVRMERRLVRFVEDDAAWKA